MSWQCPDGATKSNHQILEAHFTQETDQWTALGRVEKVSVSLMANQCSYNCLVDTKLSKSLLTMHESGSKHTLFLRHRQGAAEGDHFTPPLRREINTEENASSLDTSGNKLA